MPYSYINSESTDAAGLPAVPLVEDIPHDIASSNVSTNESRTWWFLPEHLSLPPQGRKPSRTSGVIPKPRNAYAIFRSHLGQKVLPADVPYCARQATISRVASHIWRELPADERNRFEKLFQEEQRLHQCLYPDYVIQDKSPSTVINKSKAKDVEGDEDAIKCKRIAELLLENIEGEELVVLIRELVKGGLQPGWFKITPALTGPRCITPRMDMDMAVTIVAAPAKKVVCSRSKPQRVDTKYRSSASKMHQGKAAMMRLPSPIPNQGPATLPCSGEIRMKTYADIGWDSDPIGPIYEIPLCHYTRSEVSDCFNPDDAGWKIAIEILGVCPGGGIVHEKPFDTSHSFDPLEDAGHPHKKHNNDEEDTVYVTFDPEYPFPYELYERPPPLNPHLNLEEFLMGPSYDCLVDELALSMERQSISLP